MSSVTVEVDPARGLSGVRPAYLEAVGEGRDAVVFELAPGVYGREPSDGPGALSLSDVSATRAPDLDVTLRCERGTAVLAGVPIAIAARDVTLAGVAVVGGTSPAVGITATGRVSLRDVAVMGAQWMPGSRAVLDIDAAGADGGGADLERVIVAGAVATDAAIRFGTMAGAWWQTIDLDRVTAGRVEADALIAIDAVYELRVAGGRLDADRTRVLLRLDWPAVDGRVAGSFLAADAGSLLDVRNPTPRTPPPLRLTDGTILSTDRDRLPPLVEADSSVRERMAADVGLEIGQEIAAARSRLLEIDGSIAALIDGGVAPPAS